ncbi:MAG: hypothetical protein ABH952_05550 [Candidatus Omnitrophota bacterium]
MYEYWTLVESIRTARGPRQRIVVNIGKLPGMDKEERTGWEEVRRIVRGSVHGKRRYLRTSENIPNNTSCRKLSYQRKSEA